jgi:hypothetical protein
MDRAAPAKVVASVVLLLTLSPASAGVPPGPAAPGVPGPAAPPSSSATAPAAPAAPAEDAEASRRAAYQRHFDAGRRLHDAGQYDAALLEFEAAYQAEPGPAALVNMALCYEKLDSPARPHPTAVPTAVAKLRQALVSHGASLPDDRRAAIDSKLAALTPLIGQLVLKVSPASARVTLGPVKLGPSDWSKPLEVRSGTWPLRVEAAGFAASERSAQVSSGSSTNVEIALEPIAGELVVEPAEPDSYVEVDRGKIQQGRWKGMLAPGSHEIRVFRAGGEVRSIQVAVLAGQSYRVTQAKDGALTTNAPTVAAPSGAANDAAAQPTAPELPSTTGFELLASSAILVGLHNKSIKDKYEWVGEHQPLGVGLGIRGGYRAVDWLGFVLAIEYGVTWGDGTLEPRGELNAAFPLEPDQTTRSGDIEADYTLHSWRIAGGLRTALPPDSDVRFVGEATTGVAMASIQWDADGRLLDSTLPAAANFDDTKGLEFVVGLDAGIELEFDDLLVDIVVQNWLQTTRGLEAEDAGESFFDNSVAWFVGPAVRPGFKFF